MYDVWCVMCDVWCVMCDVWCVMCDVWCVMCVVWCVMCDVWCVMCYVWYMMYDVRCVMCDVWCVMCDVWCVAINNGQVPDTWLEYMFDDYFHPKTTQPMRFELDLIVERMRHQCVECNDPEFHSYSTLIDPHWTHTPLLELSVELVQVRACVCAYYYWKLMCYVKQFHRSMRHIYFSRGKLNVVNLRSMQNDSVDTWGL